VVLAPLVYMSQPGQLQQPPDVLDQLVAQLLSCGGVLSQIIGQMVKFEGSGRSDADAAPIPEVAHSLIRGVLEPVEKRHSKRDIKVAARIVDEVTTRICEEIYVVSPDFFEAVEQADAGEVGGQPEDPVD
jgi:hypothetical protein